MKKFFYIVWRTIVETFARPFKTSVIQVEHDAPLAREVIARAFNTGKMVIANQSDDGTVKIEEFDITNEPNPELDAAFAEAKEEAERLIRHLDKGRRGA